MIKEKIFFLKQLKHKFSNNKSFLYFATIGVFLFSFVAIFVSGMSSKDQYNYQVIELYEPQSIHSDMITVVKRAYNPETNLYRMDVFISSENASTSFSDDRIEVIVVPKSNPNEELTTEIIQVTNQYYVIYVSDVPQNYGAVRTDIHYFYEETQSGFIKFYSEEGQFDSDNQLFFTESKAELMVDSIQNDIRLVEVTITENEELIVEKKGEKGNNLSEIESLKEEMKYQVGTEVEVTNSKIESFLSTNISIEEDINQLKEQNELAEEKIKLLEEKIDDVMK